MSRIISITLVLLLTTTAVFANPDCTQDELISNLLIPEFTFLTYIGVVVEEEIQIPEGLRNNEFFRESLRLTKLAQETFDFGDYDASASFAEEAIRLAELSDEHVAAHLIVEARRLLDWADANNIQAIFPDEYSESTAYYETSVEAHANEEWHPAIDAASRSIGIMAALQLDRLAQPDQPPVRTDDQIFPLPSQYTVRTWAVERDCLWNIAAYPWVYGDPWRWRDLFEANRERMPDPNNPDLIKPGFVLYIPSIRGEIREGMWDPNRTYEPMPR